jgi:ribosomal protein S11
MSKYNIYIVRAMSKKQRKAYLAIAAKYSFKKYLKLNFTFTNNNIFVNLCNGLGESLFKKTFGLIGYNGLKRKSRYALYYYGLEVGIELKQYLVNIFEDYMKNFYLKNP